MKDSYFSWLSENTASEWNNDSALASQVENAAGQGAIGCTTNPPLSYEALTTDVDYYRDSLAKIDKTLPDDEFAMQAMMLVVARWSAYFMPMHKERGGCYGCVRAQVAPNLRDDAAGMLAAGKRLAAIGKNVMVKIPGTKAGIWVLEELAALGIPTNPTVVTTVSQAIAAAEAFDRGCARAEAAGISPAWSNCAMVQGRTQDYLTALNNERQLGLTDEELSWAALAITKRCYEIFQERGYRSGLMPAAFRSPLQVEQISGGRVFSTIHPKIQEAALAADAAGNMKREELISAPLNAAAIKKVADAIPEFLLAYEPEGLAPEDFDSYGAVIMTMDGFEKEGWQKLITLKR